MNSVIDRVTNTELTALLIEAAVFAALVEILAKSEANRVDAKKFVERVKSVLFQAEAI
jgi:hypothetical protein